MWRAFFFVALLLGLTAQTAQLHCCSGTPATPSPPPPNQTLLAYMYSCANAQTCTATGADPGATAAQTLYWGYETLAHDSGAGSINAKVFANCPGRSASSTCEAYVYDEATLSACGGADSLPIDIAYYNWANANDQAAFYGPYPNLASNSSRVTDPSEGDCNSTGTGTGGTNRVWSLSPNDPTGLACLYSAFATSSTSCGWSFTGPYAVITSGEGVSMDDFGSGYQTPGLESGEYGQSANFLPGTGVNYVGTIWKTAQAATINGLCGAVCIPMVAKFMGGEEVDYCGTTTPPTGGAAGHCYANSLHFSPGTIDSRNQMDGFCTALTGGNLQGLILEDIVDRNLASTNQIAIITMMNSLTEMQVSHTGDECANLVFPLEETSPTSWPEMLGVIWMLPSSDGSPDLVPPWPTTHTDDGKEVAYLPGFELVPSGPEETPAPYSFGGGACSTVATCPSSTWCDSASTNQAPNTNGASDSGGVVALVQYCPKQYAPIMVMQYQHLRILGTDYGPAAAVVNTSSVATAIASTWFAVDSYTTYKHVIGFATCNSGAYWCEGAYVPAGYVGALLAPLQAVNRNCTDTTGTKSYCLTAPSTAINLTSATFTAGSTQVPAESAVFLTSQ